MALQTENPPAHTAQTVCNAFVEQYYNILHQSPELVYRFYQDSSVLSRPESNGVMSSVTTMQAINDKILSLDYKNFKAEIKTADAQDSYQGGVLVLVTGFLTGTDNIRKKFTQSFFLAPQDNGYFVLNDVFRYADENEQGLVAINPPEVNGASESAPSPPLTPAQEPSQAPDRHVMDPPSPPPEEMDNVEEVCDPSENEDGSVVDEVVEPVMHSSQNEEQPAVETASLVQEDAPKKSYASIVKVLKDSTTSTPVSVISMTSRVAPKSTEQLPLVSPEPASAPDAFVLSSNSTSEGSNVHEEAEGHSIYIGGLPSSATVAQLEEEFKKFGPIKPNGIQVRSHKAQGFCFGFIEFESSSSVQSAIAASPIPIGGRNAFVEEKKSSSRGTGGSGGRGRFPFGRGNIRNDSFRGRGNYGVRGYGRNDFGNHNEYSGPNRGVSGRGGEGYHRVDQNGNERNVRSGGVARRAIPV